MLNGNIDRFDSRIVDDETTCASCAQSLPSTAMIFDEWRENTFCDRECFEEWADENFEEVVKFYFRLNCE